MEDGTKDRGGIAVRTGVNDGVKYEKEEPVVETGIEIDIEVRRSVAVAVAVARPSSAALPLLFLNGLTHDFL